MTGGMPAGGVRGRGPEAPAAPRPGGPGGTGEDDVDAQLMLRVAGGDTGAFGALFDRHRPSVLRFVQRFVAQPARAEELAQDVFVKLFRHARAYRPSARFRTFLFRVATNHCLNELRRGEHREEHPGGLDGAPEPAAPAAESPEAHVAGRQLERAVGEALQALSARERAAFTLARFEGLAYRDIAEALGASEPAVKSLIHRATLAVARRVEALEAGAPGRAQTAGGGRT